MLPVPCDRCSVQGLCPESTNWASQDALAGLEGLRGTLLTSQGGRTLSAREGHERGHVETQVVLKCSQQSSRASPSGEGAGPGRQGLWVTPMHLELALQGTEARKPWKLGGQCWGEPFSWCCVNDVCRCLRLKADRLMRASYESGTLFKGCKIMSEWFVFI